MNKVYVYFPAIKSEKDGDKWWGTGTRGRENRELGMVGRVGN